MSARLVYRNNFFYYLFMPNLWTTAVLVHMGFFEIYPFYLVTKMTVIILAHTNVPWDKKLYAIKWLSPVMWVVERTISTPSTHHAHHGMHKDDHVTHYKGNYGNLLFFWDVLFGTAKITRRYPKEFGIEDLEQAPLIQELSWPIIRKTKNHKRL